jgi:iron(III) transport system substrate-binding protein
MHLRGGPDPDYKFAKIGVLQEWAVRPVGAVQGPDSGIYSSRSALAFNTDLVKSNNVPEPKCWADLLKAELKDEVQVADPNSSGTAYTLLATIVQLMGEQKGFDYLKSLHKNVNQYTKSGAAPAKAMSIGETTVGITFMHDIVTMVVDKAPIKVVAPCEGTGYEIGSMSIIKGAKNLDSAKKFYDWALSAEAQKLGAEAKSYQVPSNKSTPVPPQAPKLSDIKLINFDFAKYGSSEERKRLLSKWDSEVKNLPK